MSVVPNSGRDEMGEFDPREPSAFDRALMLAREIEAAWADQQPGWYEPPWEHLGDAERDIRVLVAGLLDAEELLAFSVPMDQA